MANQRLEDDSSSIIIRLDYESSLSAGLEAANYYLSKSIKDSTKQQFTRVYDIWTEFCKQNNVPEFGANHKQLAACLSFVMLQDGSYSKVVALSAAIAHEYRKRMLQSPTTHETISLLFRGFRNEHPQTRVAKSPITETHHQLFSISGTYIFWLHGTCLYTKQYTESIQSCTLQCGSQ